MKVAADGADAFDEPALADHAPAEIAQTALGEAVVERAIHPGNREAVEEKVVVFRVMIVNQDARQGMRADQIGAGQAAAVVEFELRLRNAGLAKKCSDGGGAVWPGAGGVGRLMPQTLAQTLGINIHAVLVASREYGGQRRFMDRNHLPVARRLRDFFVRRANRSIALYRAGYLDSVGGQSFSQYRAGVHRRIVDGDGDQRIAPAGGFAGKRDLVAVHIPV